MFHGVKHTFCTCNTEPEFTYNLRLLRRRRGCGILYLALHGSPGHVALDAVDLSLDDLAQRLGTDFRDWVIHFGTCETVDVARAILLCATLPPRTVIEEIVMSPTILRDQSADIRTARDEGAPPGAR